MKTERTELRANRAIQANLFEADIALTPGQVSGVLPPKETSVGQLPIAIQAFPTLCEET